MRESSRQIMSFGEDPHIDVQYTIPPGYNIGNGLILKDRMEKRQTVTLHNLGKTARDVRLYARLPLATLNAGDTLRIENSYDVRYPEGKRLVGIE